MALDPLHRDRQLKAIEIELATAPKIQKDLKAKFGYGENIFFDLDLIEYRINNSLPKIAEDLDVKSLYGLTKDGVAENSVGYAFRGHSDEDFKPQYQFNGLFSEEMNDMIKGSRYEKGGQATVETHGDQIRNGGRSGGLKSRGRGYWQTHPELLEEICELRNEGLSWNDTTDEFNRRHGTDYKSNSLTISYRRNKDLLNDEEE